MRRGPIVGSLMGPLARSSIASAVILGVRVATQAAMLMLVTRLLGPTLYGQYMAAASLAVVLGLIPNMGSGYVLMARAAREGHGAVETWRYGWPTSIAVGALLCLVFPYLAQLVTHGALSVTDLYLIGVTELLFTPLIQLLGFALQARDRVPMGQLMLWLPLCFRATAAAACFFASQSAIRPLVIWQAVAAAMGLAVSVAVVSRCVRLPWKPRRPTSQELRSGAAYAAMHVVAANPGELDKITAPLLVGDHAAGIYSASSRVMGAVVTPMLGVLVASQPRLFRHGSSPTREGTRLIRALAYVSAAWGAISALTMILAAPLLPYLFGHRFADTADVLPWVALAAPFASLRIAAGTVLVALGKPLQRLRFELIGVIVLACLLAAGAHLSGLRGMAIGLAAAEACMALYGWLLIRADGRRSCGRGEGAHATEQDVARATVCRKGRTHTQ